MNRRLRVFFKVIAEHPVKNRVYISIAMVLLPTVNLFPGVMVQSLFAGKLYKSLFHDVPVSEIKTSNLPEDLKRRLDEYKNRSLVFHSMLDDCRALPGDEVPICDVRRRVEKGIVSLINRKVIEKAAAEYAKRKALLRVGRVC